MNIAYCSPFNPIKSGISDFSEELIMELKQYVKIDLFYNKQPSKKEIQDNFNSYNIKELNKEVVRNKYDVIVYHMGNNIDYHKCIAEAFMNYPGILELHDFSLHNYLAGDTYIHNDIDGYINCIRYCHGERGVKIAQNFLNGNARAPWETHALELTVNKHYIDKAKGIIVHSDMAKQMVKGIRPGVPVINIPLHTPDIIEDHELTKINAKKLLNISPETLVLGSFGYATSAKRILETLDALALYAKNKTKNFHYFIVGKVEGIDVNSKISKLGMEKNVTVTGFTKLDEFKNYMRACDICLNLRYPTHGESSASLHRMFGMGKPVIVTDIGTFQDYPDDIAIKVRYDDNEVKDIYDAICELTKNKKILKEIGEKAVLYAKQNCDIKKNALRYIEFFKQIQQNQFEEEEIDNLIDKLFELGLTDDLYIEHITKDKLF